MVDIEKVSAHIKAQAIALGVNPDVTGIAFIDS